MKKMRKQVQVCLANLTEELEKKVKPEMSFTIGYIEFRGDFIEMQFQLWKERRFKDNICCILHNVHNESDIEDFLSKVYEQIGRN